MSKQQKINRVIAEAEARELSIQEAAALLGRLNAGKKYQISDKDRARRRAWAKKMGKMNRKGTKNHE